MDVFGCGTDEPSRPLLPPGLCAICDQSPTQEAERVIDTRRNTFKGVSGASERKYICESCATEMGAAMGMVPLDAHVREMNISAELADEVDSLKQRLAEAVVAQTRVVSSDDIIRLMDEKFKELRDAKPKPPARKPAASA